MADVRTIQTQCRKRHRTPKEPAEVLWRSGKEKFHICEKMPPSQARTEHISEGKQGLFAALLINRHF